MKAMKDRKASGDEGIQVELLKAGGIELVRALLDLFNRAFELEEIREDWQRGVVCPIKKKVEGTVCGNHRGMTLLSHTGKVYSRIIERRIRECVKHTLEECQHGFRPGKSTTELLFTMKMMMEKRWEWNIEKFILLIDLEKAFDQVKRQTLWQVLADSHYSMPPKLQRVTKSFYRRCISRVKTQTVESDSFDIKIGVRQGDVLSPLLFIIFMDKCIRDIDGRGEVRRL